MSTRSSIFPPTLRLSCSAGPARPHPPAKARRERRFECGQPLLERLDSMLCPGQEILLLQGSELGQVALIDPGVAEVQLGRARFGAQRAQGIPQARVERERSLPQSSCELL